MQDGAAEINLNEDSVRSRRWRQLKLIVLQEEQAPDGRGARSPALPFNGQLLLTARIYPSPQQFTAAVNLELFTVKST